MSGLNSISNGHEQLLVDPRTYTQHIPRPDPRKVRIYDTTLRDGEQTPGVAIPPEEKYLIARELSDLGCHILDVGFPASAPSECEALRKILAGRKKGELREDLEILVMCRAVREDIDVTVEAITSIGYSPSEVTFLVFSSASGLHCKYKLGQTLLRRISTTTKDLREIPVEEFYEANKAMVSEAIQYALARGAGKVEFGAEDASRAPLDKLLDLVHTSVNAGAFRYVFADTTGSCTPEAMRFYSEALKAEFPDIELASHVHNDFDLATMNVITGVLYGLPTFSTTINGIGERAGNAPLHSVVSALRNLYGIEIPNFRYERLAHVKDLVERITGIPVQVNEPVIGYNAFSHESGIHTHGVKICREMYEPLPYQQVGGRPRFVCGKSSGTNAVAELLRRHEEEIGCAIDPPFVLAVLREIKRLHEQRTREGRGAAFVRSYYAHLDGLGISDHETVELARDLVRQSLAVQKKPRAAAAVVAS